MDNGASYHITSDVHNMSFASPYERSDQLTVRKGKSLSISHIGYSVIQFHDTHLKPFTLKCMLPVPAITKNLISISQLIRDNNIVVEFSDKGCLFKNQVSWTILLRGVLKDGLYSLNTFISKSASSEQAILPIPSSSSSYSKAYSTYFATATANSWHAKLGHPSTSVMNLVFEAMNLKIPRNCVNFLTLVSMENCISYHLNIIL